VQRLVCAAALATAVVARVSMAHAQGADEAAAESLFQAGKALLEQRNYTEACPKLAESYRLDPGTGTLLALALCHEGEGRLASAWGEFADVLARSRREGRPEREALARQHKAALESRLPMLTISVAAGADQAPGFEIKRDGVAVGQGSWATPVPVDPGHHHVEAAAPGCKTFAVTVSLLGDASREAVVVPPLECAPAGEAAPAGAAAGFWSPLRYAALAVGGLGVAGVAVGSAFGLQAIALNNDSKANCNAQSQCSQPGFSTRHDAQSAGNVSTVGFVAGGALLAAGTTLFVLGRRAPASGAALRTVPWVSAREVGLGVQGAF